MAWYDKFVPAPPPIPKDMSWLDKFAPHTTAPTEQTITTPLPVTEGAHSSMQLEDIILGYNNDLSNFETGNVVWPLPTASAQVLGEGVLIHKITLEQAAEISTRIKYSLGDLTANLPGIDPLSYVLACLAIESTLDPNCQNANTGVNSLGVARSNPTNDPLKYDMGLCQFKLEFLIYTKALRDRTTGAIVTDSHGVAVEVPGIPGVVDHDSALAFALDVNRAIPYFVSLMADKLLWAQNVIERNSSSAPDVRFTGAAGAMLLATGAYNFGETGMLTYYENGTFPSHCQHVIDLEKYFSTKRGVTSLFASLPQ